MNAVRAFQFLLFSLIVLEAWWLGYALPGKLSGTMVLVAPLLMTAPFVVTGRHRARLVAVLVSLPYFIHAVTEFSVGRSMAALAISGLCLLLYVALVLAARRHN